jgi:hypothetical protein
VSVGDETDAETEVKSMIAPIYSCKLVRYSKKKSLFYSENIPLMLARRVQNAVESPNS